MKSSQFLFILAIISGILPDILNAQNEWLLKIEGEKGTVIIYQRQFESFANDNNQSRFYTYPSQGNYRSGARSGGGSAGRLR
ncbi:MAG: hypothetical protein JW833_17830 [Prolixibacteraceae bacterium]|nr:hypothetical protein [Prolixibacteraceae bacterium]